MSDRVRVRCTRSRRVGDDDYSAGEEYEIDAARADRYAEYFAVIGPAAKRRAAPEDKQRAAPATKPRDDAAGDTPGWPNRRGVAVHLDGTPAGAEGGDHVEDPGHGADEQD